MNSTLMTKASIALMNWLNGDAKTRTIDKQIWLVQCNRIVMPLIFVMFKVPSSKSTYLQQQLTFLLKAIFTDSGQLVLSVLSTNNPL